MQRVLRAAREVEGLANPYLELEGCVAFVRATEKLYLRRLVA
jgi:hypothetical protein